MAAEGAVGMLNAVDEPAGIKAEPLFIAR